MKFAKACVLAWTRLYTAGMPDEIRVGRRAEIESDLWEFEHDPDRAPYGSTAHLFLRLIPGIWQDLRWRFEQHAPLVVQHRLMLNAPARQPFVVISAFTCSLTFHLLAGATAVWLATYPGQEISANFSKPFSAWKRVSNSASRVIAAASAAVGIASAPDLASAVQTASAAPTSPAEPISAIVNAFKTHQIVALGDPHGNEQIHTFRLALISDPRFAEVVNDIVVEFGSALHQDLIDRYVHGENIPYELLRRVWRDTTVAAPNWDLPIYEEFFRAVRDVNAARPPDRQLRVLLGDPPLDWNTTKTFEDFERFMGRPTDDAIRSTHPAGVVQREVIGRNRRALLIYGEAHFWRVWPGRPSRSLVARLEERGTKVFTVATTHASIGGDVRTLQADVARWKVPSLALLKDTQLGVARFRFFQPYFGNPDRDPMRDVRMEEQFDALLYLGPRKAMTQSQLPADLCRDQAYIDMRIHRMELVSKATPGGAAGPINRLKESCKDTP